MAIAYERNFQPNWRRPRVRMIDPMSTGFLDRLATQLRVNKSSACRRAIQRILAVVKENFEAGKYKSSVEAESDFRQLVGRDETCK
jgi:hypothetical protein